MNIAIKQTLPNLPTTPGIYQMIAENGEILYIGKAKDLRRRVAYYTKNDLTERLKRMVFQVRKLEYTTTASEAEALILEARLIKKHQPKYNILLKDDKSFPYIRFRDDHPFPQALKYRSKTPPNDKFFGPFASSYDVDMTLLELQKIFKLRSCTDNYFESRKRPCLQYQIKRCYAPCVGKIEREEYAELASQVLSFLSGKNQELQKELAKQMDMLSHKREYEKAAEIRDRIKALSYVQLKFGQAQYMFSDADLVIVDELHGVFAVFVAFYRSGQYYGNKIYFPVHTEGATHKEVLEAFILQFYQDKPCPSEILINYDLENKEELEQALHKESKSVKITVPVRGAKLQLMHSFEHTVKEALEKRLRANIKQNHILKSIQTLFDLPAEPERIEVYDNSHIMGKHAVGAMIVAGREGFERSEYRYLNVTPGSITGGDDYEMLRQVMKRRLERIRKNQSPNPSLMIIDGGKGHMSTVEAVMKEAGIYVTFVCMSKGEDRNSGREWFHIPGRESFTMPFNDKVMQYLQILRDEAHNYAIKKHRLKRSKSITTSALDEIEGVGIVRKKDLLQKFGSIERIKNASLEELANIKSVGKSTARKVFDALHYKSN